MSTSLKHRLSRFAINCFLCTIAPVAIACSPLPGYVRPTNFELVQLADAIVIATAQERAADRGGEFEGMGVSFRVTKILKGETPPSFALYDVRLGNPRLSDASQIAEPHDEAYMGPCTRVTLAKGRSYVLFLARDDAGNPVQLGYPFARVNEDYTGPNSLWTQTVQAYVSIEQRYEPMEQLDQLESLMKAKAAEKATESKLLAADILDHVRSRSPYKPTQYLVNTYEAIERGESLVYPLRPTSHDLEKSLAQNLTNQLYGTTAPKKPEREQEMQFVLNSLVAGSHPGALPLFERLISQRDVQIGTFGLALRFIAGVDVLRAFELVRTQALAALPLLPRSEATQLVADIGEAMNGSYSQEGKERWRSHPVVFARWPEMAFALHRYQQLVSIDGYRFIAEIDSLPLTDYRVRPDVTLARAKHFDQEVEAWAIKELNDESLRASFEASVASDDDEEEQDDARDPAWVPLQALVVGSGDERDATLKRVFCQSTARRLLLFAALAKWGDETIDKYIIGSMAASRDLTEEEHDGLRKAMASIYARDAARNESARGIWRSSIDDWYELLKSDFQRTHSDDQPIDCQK